MFLQEKFVSSPYIKSPRRKPNMSDTTNCDVRNSKKRKASDSIEHLGLQHNGLLSSNESSLDSDSPPFSNLNKWTKDTLDRLNIVTTTTAHYTPMQLISRAYEHINYNYRIEMEEKIKLFKEHILVRSPLHRLNVNGLEAVDTRLAYQIKSYMNRFLVDDPWNKAAEEKVNDFRLWHKFHTHGEQFVQQLVYLSMKQRSSTITEEMYKHLFEKFVAIFGLCCLSVPHQEFKMQIGEKQVTSIPDVVFPSVVSTNEEEVDIIAICKAKRKYEEEDEQSVNITNTTRKQRTQVIDHIDDLLLGQLGGDLLASLPFSKNQRGLLGMILQETCITFCHFDCTPEQCDEIKKGNPDMAVKPQICFSKPYNYLNAADREELMEPLLKLDAAISLFLPAKSKSQI